MERTYELNTSAADPDNDAPDREGLRMMFTVHLAGLAADSDRYLARDELAQLQERMAEVLGPFVAQRPPPGRTRRILSTILMPDR